MPDPQVPASTEQGDVASTLNQSRLSAVDRIAAAREAEFAAESGHQFADEPPADTPADPPVDPPEDPHANDEQIAANLADDETFVPPEMLGRKVRLKIDGQETDVTLDELVRGAQKNAAADRRLQEATQLLRDAQVAASPKTVDKIPTSPATNPPPQESVVARVKDALQAVFNGDEDAAATKLAELLTPPAPQAAHPVVDIDAVADAATRKLDERSALARFFEAYPNVEKFPYLGNRADELFRQHAAAGLGYEKALMAAGKDLYGELGWELPTRTEPPKPEPTTGRSQTLAARKAALEPPASRTASAATVTPPADSSEEERSSVVREMAARRNPGMQALKNVAR